MVPLIARRAVALLACVLAGTFTPAQETAPAATEAAPGAAVSAPAALVLEAEAAYATAEFERARDLASRAVEASGAAPVDATAFAAWNAVAPRALELLALAHYGLGDKPKATQTIEQLLQTAPDYRVDTAKTGQRFAALFEERRQKLVGYVAPSCVPSPCEIVEVGGRARTLDAEGRVAVAAGPHTIVLGRRNFRRAIAENVQVAAGQRVGVEAKLELEARDVKVATRPPGARITIDQQAVGTTAPGQDHAGASAPLVVPSLAPGPHAMLVQAPCFRRVEVALDVVLDAQNLEAQDFGVVALERARAVLQINWDPAAGGTLALNGQPVQPGTHEICPGPHEISLTLGGRRVWFQAIDVKDEDVVPLTPRARPTVAVTRENGAPRLPPGFPGDEWNVSALAKAAADDLAARIGDRVAQAPVWPQIGRVSVEGLAAAVRAAAPEADALALVLPGRDPVRAVVVLALVDARRDVLELTSWPEGDAKSAAAAGAELNRPLVLTEPTLGFDIASRAGRNPVVATVLRGGPAAGAGLAPGQEVVAVAGRPMTGPADLAAVEQALGAAEVAVRIVDAAGERDVAVAPVIVLVAPAPALLRRATDRFLVAALARAEAARAGGAPVERVAAGVFQGLALAALGQNQEAAAALDRAGVDETLDLAGDARGTVAFVLESLLRRLGKDAYAQEVRARWTVLDSARLGGRRGPPLRAASDSEGD